MRLIPPQAAPTEMPAHFDLGKTNAEVTFNTADANRNAALSLVRQASHVVCLYTQDLEAKVLNDERFVKLFIELIKRNKLMKIQILVKDSAKIIKTSHVLIRLAQQLSTHVEVKAIPDVFYTERGSFLVVDRKGFYYRPDASMPSGTVNFNSPGRAAKLLEYFTNVWDKAAPDPHFRKMHI